MQIVNILRGAALALDAIAGPTPSRRHHGDGHFRSVERVHRITEAHEARLAHLPPDETRPASRQAIRKVQRQIAKVRRSTAKAELLRARARRKVDPAAYRLAIDKATGLFLTARQAEALRGV